MKGAKHLPYGGSIFRRGSSDFNRSEVFHKRIIPIDVGIPGDVRIEVLDRAPKPSYGDNASIGLRLREAWSRDGNLVPTLQK